MKVSNTNISKHTKVLYLPLASFKNPNQRFLDSQLRDGQLGFVLPSNEVIVVEPYHTIVLGRQPNEDKEQIMIDLTGTNRDADGVSRSHAIIQFVKGDVYISDNKSSNGTYLNDAELYPLRKYVLNDGDKLRLGRLEIEISFITRDKIE